MYMWNFKNPLTFICSVIWNLSEFINFNLMGKYVPNFFGIIIESKGKQINKKEKKQ